MKDIGNIKNQIILALSHNEAEEGLYFRNLFHLHEEDERPAVIAEQVDILDALKELISEDKITMDETGEEPVFKLKNLI